LQGYGAARQESKCRLTQRTSLHPITLGHILIK
jgi:hypothetical protein